jgi:hypothetical protein
MVASISQVWPDFESKTGWSVSGQYEEMSAELRRELVDFYAPHNERLFHYLGRRFNWS